MEEFLSYSHGTSFQMLSIQHVIDGVAQEKNETYNLTISNSFNLDLFSFEGITVTIIDADRKLTLCQLVCPIIKTYIDMDSDLVKPV